MTRHGSNPLIGQELQYVKLKELETKVNDYPFVEKSQVNRTIDGYIEIKVEQVKPMARIIRDNMPDQYVTSNGEIIPFSEKYTARVLLITGEFYTFLTEENLTNPEGLQFLNFLKHINQNAFYQAQITQLDIDVNGQISISPLVGNETLLFGHWSNYELKLKKLKTYYKKIAPAKGWNEYKTVNLKFDDQIICGK